MYVNRYTSVQELLKILKKSAYLHNFNCWMRKMKSAEWSQKLWPHSQKDTCMSVLNAKGSSKTRTGSVLCKGALNMHSILMRSVGLRLPSSGQVTWSAKCPETSVAGTARTIWAPLSLTDSKLDGCWSAVARGPQRINTKWALFRPHRLDCDQMSCPEESGCSPGMQRLDHWRSRSIGTVCLLVRSSLTFHGFIQVNLVWSIYQMNICSLLFWDQRYANWSKLGSDHMDRTMIINNVIWKIIPVCSLTSTFSKEEISLRSH